MSGIAEVLVNMGCRVTGSDLSDNAQVERLKAMGVTIFHEHSSSNVSSDCHAVVYSSAVNVKNPEIIEARKKKIPVIQRAEMLAEIMRLKRGIAIGGTHGKTTTTSMVATALLHAGMDPTIVVGGRLDLIKSTAALGKGSWLVAEADESDRSFLRLSPEIAVVTNIDNDHLENYADFDDLKKSFQTFIGRIPFYGCAIMCIDDPSVAQLAKHFPKRMITYGFSAKADLRAENLYMQSFDVTLKGEKLGKVNLSVPGNHNVLNSLAALAVGLELGLSFDKISEGLSFYKGVDRRIQKIGETTGVQVYDDYGHHPTEVRATLQALRQLFPKNKITVAFQPHRYSRTKLCWKDFLKCFKDADNVGILDIYPAGEKKIKGVDSKKLAAAAKKQSRRNIFYTGNHKNTLVQIDKALKPGDVLLTLGAGDVHKIGREFLKLKK